MIRFTLFTAAAVLGAALATVAPAHAAPIDPQSATTVVNLDDVDLATQHGREEARQRLALASEQVCARIGADASVDDRLECQHQAFSNARRALAHKMTERHAYTEVAFTPR